MRNRYVNDLDSSSHELGFCVQENKKMDQVSVDISGVSVKLIVDSGATCNIINTAIRTRLDDCGVRFVKSSRVIHPYASLTLHALVEAHVMIRFQDKTVTTTLTCIEGDSQPLLSSKSTQALDILTLAHVNLTGDDTETLREIPRHHERHRQTS